MFPWKCVLSAVMNSRSPVHRKLRGSSDQRAAFLSSRPQSPWDTSDGCHSTALTASVGTHRHIYKVKPSSTAKHTHTKSGPVNSYLKIPSFFKDGNHRFVDVSDELVSLWFPQIVHTQLQLLYQGVLHSTARSGSILEGKGKPSSSCVTSTSHLLKLATLVMIIKCYFIEKKN